MPRESSHKDKGIALLATGDEIINGDILNSNAQIIAQKLFRYGIPVGTHMTAADNVQEIEQAITYLLTDHRGLIITGGLGPTSDDLTRYALGSALNRPLHFDEPTWDDICARFKLLGYQGEPPAGNRQQAFFPEGAVIIPNPNGTAAGCMLEHENHFIFMLPGPPFECLPMVDKVVLNTLQEKGFQETLYYDHWLLFGIGESLIANKLDALAKPFDCMTGYRIAFPYIEVKISSKQKDDFQKLVPLIEQAIAPYLLNDGKEPASQTLLARLAQGTGSFNIHDAATGGLLENTLMTPNTCARIRFSEKQEANLKITGLTEYWTQQDTETTLLELTFSNGVHIQKEIQLRGREQRVRQFVTEFVCHQMLQFL